MKIKATSVYVDDQEKSARFYTEMLGFQCTSAPGHDARPLAVADQPNATDC